MQPGAENQLDCLPCLDIEWRPWSVSIAWHLLTGLTMVSGCIAHDAKSHAQKHACIPAQS